MTQQRETVAEKLKRFEKDGPSEPFLEPEGGGFEFGQATDGCQVEPDGYCEHGHVSWLLYLGLI